MLFAQCLKGSGNSVSVSTCDGSPSQKWKFDRKAGGTLTNGQKCITRKGSVISLATCDRSPSQVWQRLCGAWANGHDASGRVLEIGSLFRRLGESNRVSAGNPLLESNRVSPYGVAAEEFSKPEDLGETVKENLGRRGSATRAGQWGGSLQQLWDFTEQIKHSACSKKRFKVLKFSGSSSTTVAIHKFLSMPHDQVCVLMWLKGKSGTPFSYSSTNYVNSFVISNVKSLVVYVKDKKFETKKDIVGGGENWVHLSVCWSAAKGSLNVFKNAVNIYSSPVPVSKGAHLTAGGCLQLGQMQQKLCGNAVAGASYNGLMSDVMVWRKQHTATEIKKYMYQPVSPTILARAGKVNTPKTPQELRLALLSRQYSAEETKKTFPPVCTLDKFKKKEAPKITGPPGMMRCSGSGDVHYKSFAGCKFDDQSIGEWVAVKVMPKHFASAPIIIEFRTSSRNTRCAWCQNGAVSLMDGCAVKYGDDQASAGFGGFSTRYTPHAVMNGKPLSGGWKRNQKFRAKASTHRFSAILNDGTSIYCSKGGSININMPRKYTGKIGGICGDGGGANSDWKYGPNKGAVAGTGSEGTLHASMRGKCMPRFQYRIRSSPFNGNHVTKPIVKFFGSWQVDGQHLPSVFYYKSGTGAGSFNRKAGAKIKPPSDVNARPAGARAKATEACKDLRQTPKALEKCIFDYMVLGKTAIKGNQRDRMSKRQAGVKKPTS